MNTKKLVIAVAFLLVLVGAATGGAVSDRLFGVKLLDKWWPRNVGTQEVPGGGTQKILTEESVVIDVAEKVSPSVVTIGIKKTQVLRQPSFSFDPFSDPFGFFRQAPGQTREENIEQDIGSGFVISADGMVVTNKHVVDDTEASYRVITKDDTTYEVERIFRDPATDLAILKIAATDLKPVDLGDSDQLKVGQMAIAIGTALGEFRHTVTTGVVSGLGRGIKAGSAFAGDVESLDNVIQTDAAINPGNSGGPLLNSAGQVIGVNTAISVQGQNIGFAIPINIVKQAIDNFNKTGRFDRPYLGIRYRLIDQRTAILNEVPQGAYIEDVLSNSPAQKGGIEAGDIITKLDGKKVNDDSNSVASIVSGRKVGETIEVEIWREGETLKLNVKLEVAQ